MLCHVCYGLLPTFPLLSSDDDEGGREERERTLNVNLTNKWSERTTRKDFRRRRRRRKHARCILSPQLGIWYVITTPQFAKSLIVHECPLRRVNERR